VPAVAGCRLKVEGSQAASGAGAAGRVDGLVDCWINGVVSEEVGVVEWWSGGVAS